MVAVLKADTDGTASYQLLVLKELITTMTVRACQSISQSVIQPPN